MTKGPRLRRAILLGPSIDLPRFRRANWVRERLGRAGLSESDLRVGVDAGIELWELFPEKFRPQLVVGDFDSASPAAVKQLRKTETLVLALPTGKDQSDLSCALELLREFAPEEVLLLGFTGGRPDHHLSNLLEIGHYAAARPARGAGGGKPKKTAAIGPEAEYHFLTPEQKEFKPGIPAGSLVSVFAWGGATEGVSMQGFKYNLRNQKLEPSSRGLSNVVRSAGSARISVRKGVLLVVIPTPAGAKHAR